MSVPNQKIVTIEKEPCDKEHLYSMTNLNAEDKAAQDLDGNCFKLWRYFARNQKGYKFALSSADVAKRFGLKSDAYNRAVKILTEKRYLICLGGNNYHFREDPAASDARNATLPGIQTNGATLLGFQSEVTTLPEFQIDSNHVTGKTNNAVTGKTNNALQEKPVRNITDNTYNNTYTALRAGTPSLPKMNEEYRKMWYND